MKKLVVALLILSIVFLVISWSFYSQGTDKKENYYNSDYSSLNKNAYVGGDAYNYIINGNYSTGYYVLSMGFFISGISCLCSSAIIGTLISTRAKDND